jgi:hypothetical protein
MILLPPNKTPKGYLLLSICVVFCCVCHDTFQKQRITLFTCQSLYLRFRSWNRKIQNFIFYAAWQYHFALLGNQRTASDSQTSCIFIWTLFVANKKSLLGFCTSCSPEWLHTRVSRVRFRNCGDFSGIVELGVHFFSFVGWNILWNLIIMQNDSARFSRSGSLLQTWFNLIKLKNQ